MKAAAFAWDRNGDIVVLQPSQVRARTAVLRRLRGEPTQPRQTGAPFAVGDWVATRDGFVYRPAGRVVMVAKPAGGPDWILQVRPDGDGFPYLIESMKVRRIPPPKRR